MSKGKTGVFGYRGGEGIWSNIFSSHTFEPVLDRAEGIYLYDTEGRKYIDVSGGPMAIGMAHGDERINEAIKKQLDKFAYCHPMLSNQPKAELCEKLSQITPGDLNTTYLSPGGGSDAIESAIKLARQFHLSQGNMEKHMIISHYDSYHGMSLGALSATGSAGMKKLFEPILLKWPKTHQYSDHRRPSDLSREEWGVRMAQELEEAIYWNGSRYISAFMATPIGCSYEYGLIPPKSYYKTIREICDANDILYIDDEVVSGFGRTGKWFCVEHLDVQPDIIVAGKGITSLYAPLGAVIVSDKVNEPFRKNTYFNHGFTNQGHPVSCAAALAAIDILEKDNLIENSAKVGEYLHSCKDRLLAHPTVADIRGKGLFMVMEVVADKESMDFFPRDAHAEYWLQSIGLKNGAVFYSTLHGIRMPSMEKRGLPYWIAPPLCITKEQIDELLEVVDNTLIEWEKKMGV